MEVLVAGSFGMTWRRPVTEARVQQPSRNSRQAEINTTATEAEAARFTISRERRDTPATKITAVKSEIRDTPFIRSPERGAAADSQNQGLGDGVRTGKSSRDHGRGDDQGRGPVATNQQTEITITVDEVQ